MHGTIRISRRETLNPGDGDHGRGNVNRWRRAGAPCCSGTATSARRQRTRPPEEGRRVPSRRGPELRGEPHARSMEGHSLARSVLIDSARSGLMDSSLFQSAVGMMDADLLRSACLFQSVVHGETPEQTVLRIREEREELKFQLQQAAEIGQRTIQQLEATELQRDSQAEQTEELSRRLSDMARDLEEKDYRVREVLQAMEAMDAHARQVEIERDEAMAQDREPEPQGELTASGTFLTKSEGLRRVAEEKDRRAAEAEARVREKEKLVIGLAKDVDRFKQEVDELLRKNEQEIAERHEQNVSFLQCSC